MVYGTKSDETYVDIFRGKDGSALPMALNDGSKRISHPFTDFGYGVIDLVDWPIDPPLPTEWNLPVAFVVGDGAIYAACVSQLNSGLDPAQAAISYCRWLESSPPRWVLGRRSPPQQLGAGRGRSWMLTGPWCRSRSSDENARIDDFFVAIADYRNQVNNPITQDYPKGASFLLARAQRQVENNVTTWITSSRYLYEATFPESFFYIADNTNPLRKWNDSGMHGHTMSVIFPDGADGQIVCMLSLGDSWANNRIAILQRPDLTSGLGWNGGDPDTPAVAEPTPNTFSNGASYASDFPPAPVNDSTTGWTAYEDRNGQRRRIRFERVSWDATAKTLGLAANSPFQKLAAISNGQQVILGFITYGPPPGENIYRSDFAIVTGHAAGSGTVTVEWNGAPATNVAYDGTPSTDISGFVMADTSMQFIAQVPLANPAHVLIGGDENIVPIYRIEVGSGTHAVNRFQSKVVWGVPPEMRKDTDAGLILNWNCLLIYCALPLQGKHYAAIVTPGSIDGWGMGTPNLEAASILYSEDGATWGDLYQIRDVQLRGCGWWGTEAFAITQVYTRISQSLPDQSGVIRTLTEPSPRIVLIKKPVVSKQRPLGISPGGENLLLSAGLTRLAPPELGNELTRFTPTSAPSFGDAWRFSMGGGGALGILQLTGAIDNPMGLDDCYIRVKMFINALGSTNANPLSPPSGTGAEAPDAPAGAFRITFGVGGSNANGLLFFQAPRSLPIDIRAVGGSGWVPVTVTTRKKDWSQGNPNFDFSNFALAAEFVGIGTGATRQSFEVIFDSVTATFLPSNGIPALDVASQPLLTSSDATAPSQIEKLALTLPSQPSGGWTAYFALRIPDTGADVFSKRPAARVAFTIKQSNSSWLSVVFERDVGMGGSVVISDQSGRQFSISRPTATIPAVLDPVPPSYEYFDQSFYFLKGRQILFALSRVLVNPGNPTPVYRYDYAVSVGGSVVKSGVVANTRLSTIAPTSIRSGDSNGENVDAMEWFQVTFDNAVGAPAADLRTALETLSFMGT